MLNWYRGMVRGGLPPELAGKCPAIDIPTLVIWGDGDVALDVLCLEGLETYVSNLRIEHLPGVSHWVQEEAPDTVNALITGFLNEGNTTAAAEKT
jgi:pimeloyl-ACP methyl ester carboxylesterase